MKENAKDKLIQTASRLFQLQGYHATGLNQITKESGAPKGSLYHYFPDGKEELAYEAVQLTTHFVSEQIKNGLSSSEDPVEAIQTFILDMADRFSHQHSLTGIPIATIALETSLISEPLRQACQTAYREFQSQFTEKLLQGGYEEERATELGIVINAMIEGAFLVSFSLGENEPLRMVAKQIPVLLK